MSKVFSYFNKNLFVNNKIVIPIIIGIAVMIGGIVAISNQESNVIEVEYGDEGVTPTEENIQEIQDKLDKIEEINLENEYSPKPREWITSGPFQIDRSEYILGEKIFMIAEGIGFDEKGEIALLRPLNDTHYSVYFTMPFDGTERSAFNYYFEPKLSKINGYCSVDDFIGDWRIVFRGTNYSNLEFKITEEILPGNEENFEPVC